MDVDPGDRLPISEVGEWALEKHERLRKYVDISRQARRKYIDPSRSKLRGAVGGATYIDLFCGPGRCRVRETGEIIDGSPLVAYKAAVAGKVQFTEIHLADLNADFSAAAASRVNALSGHAMGYCGSAETTVQEIVSRLNPAGLHFAFLDPFNLEGLCFEVIRRLSSLQRIDLLLHVSVQDLQRNLDRYIAAENSPLDSFAPGWREHVDVKQAMPAFRAALLEYWQSLVGQLGFPHQWGELVTGSRGQRLYWLIFLSRHERANEFWNKIRHISGQKTLGLE